MIVWWRLAYVWWKCPKDKNKWMCRSHESQSRDVVMIKFKTFLCSYESQSRDVRRIETNETYLMCSHESQSTVQCDRIETIYLCYHEWQSRDSKNWPTIWESKKIQSHFPQPIWYIYIYIYTFTINIKRNVSKLHPKISTFYRFSSLVMFPETQSTALRTVLGRA